MTDLEAWLSRIEGLHPSTIELGLDRIRQVYQTLDCPSITCPIITITGTNGKGSTVALLKEIYHQAGFRVGAYTSPHLLHFNERIQIGHDCIEDASLVAAFEQIESARGDIALTYFEFTTLAAFYYFAHSQCDVLLLEVGLGGRLDAVNLLDPSLAIVTNIGLDHCDYLGNTREAIGAEKAGIFRQNQIAICGDRRPPDSVLEKADALDCSLFCLGRDSDISLSDEQLRFQFGKTVWTDLPKPLFLLDNVASALMAIVCLNDRLAVDKTAIVQGLESARLPGRLQVMPGDVTWVFDVAHNADSVGALANWLAANPIAGRTWALFSMLADKDIAGTVSRVSDEIQHWSVTCLEAPRAASATQLQSALSGLDYDFHANFKQAYQAILKRAQTGDRVVVFGSFYTVANALEMGV